VDLKIVMWTRMDLAEKGERNVVVENILSLTAFAASEANFQRRLWHRKRLVGHGRARMSTEPISARLGIVPPERARGDREIT
jgi:hypothetical protein